MDVVHPRTQFPSSFFFSFFSTQFAAAARWCCGTPSHLPCFFSILHRQIPRTALSKNNNKRRILTTMYFKHFPKLSNLL
jgi:hypothetical protein